jgi:hypothetical protein
MTCGKTITKPILDNHFSPQKTVLYNNFVPRTGSDSKFPKACPGLRAETEEASNKQKSLGNIFSHSLHLIN